MPKGNAQLIFVELIKLKINSLLTFNIIYMLGNLKSTLKSDLGLYK